MFLKYYKNYRYTVIDNEAGMEHIARGILPHIDVLFLVSDCSRRGIMTVGRIAEMVKELNLKPGCMKLIVNRAPGGELNAGVLDEIKKQGLDLAGVLPHDENVYNADCNGEPSAKIPQSSAIKQALNEILNGMNI